MTAIKIAETVIIPKTPMPCSGHLLRVEVVDGEQHGVGEGQGLVMAQVEVLERVEGVVRTASAAEGSGQGLEGPRFLGLVLPRILHLHE